MIPFKPIGHKKDGPLFRFRARHCNGRSWRKGLIYAGNSDSAGLVLAAHRFLAGYRLDYKSIREAAKSIGYELIGEMGSTYWEQRKAGKA